MSVVADTDADERSALRLSLVSVLSVISAMISWRDSILAIFSIPNR
jgi:hypothetical protein